MADTVDIAQEIVAREGGFVDDPDDPGGPTKYGVTLGTLQRLGIDVTGDDRIDIRDVKALSKEQVVKIFLRHYFHRPRIADLPEPLQASVFDMYVNAGRNAVRILQRLLRQMNFRVAVDGIIGPQTIKAAERACKHRADRIADAYGIARRNYYFRLADRRSGLRKFARTRAGGKGGWITRAESFVSERYHLTQAEFQKRTLSWD